MNLDDETLLDAYLDDELDPASRLRVEAALLASPSLAERLGERSRVRQAVAELPRPMAPRDLSAAVLAQVAARPPFWYRRLGWSRSLTSRQFLTGAGVGIAAGLLIGLGVARPWSPPHPRPRPAAPTVAVVPPQPAPFEPAPAPEEPTPSPAAVDPALPPATPHVSPVLVRDDEAERTRIRALLDRPEVRRVFIFADATDEDVLGRVDGALRRSFRKESRFGRITIGMGLVVDPDHPGKATVFALAADDRELKRLTSDLSDQFPGQIAIESRPTPAPVVTMLADVGQVATFEGTAAAGLSDLPADDPRAVDRALRIEAEDGPPPPAPRNRRPSNPPAGGPADEAGTVLVWVSDAPTP